MSTLSNVLILWIFFCYMYYLSVFLVNGIWFHYESLFQLQLSTEILNLNLSWIHGERISVHCCQINEGIIKHHIYEIICVAGLFFSRFWIFRVNLFFCIKSHWQASIAFVYFCRGYISVLLFSAYSSLAPLCYSWASY